jgi:hypothetical protein
MGDLVKGHGWGQPEKLNIRLMAFDTAFIGGPGKERGVENYSTLLVDGAYGKPVKGVFHAGQSIASKATDDGGYVIVGAGDFYKSLGVAGAKRHLLVKFSDPDKNTAIVSTLDDITSDAEHTYTWQANLGPEGIQKPAQPAPLKKKAPKPKLPGMDEKERGDDIGLSLEDPARKAARAAAEEAAKPPPPKLKPNDDGVKSEAGTESGRPFFLLTGRNGHVKGWVLHPSDAKITVGDPLRIETKAANAKIWVVMRAAPGKPPVANVSGAGMKSKLEVAGQTVAFDQDRITVE